MHIHVYAICIGILREKHNLHNYSLTVVEAEQMPTIQLEKHLFTEDKNPEVVFCVKVSHDQWMFTLLMILACVLY